MIHSIGRVAQQRGRVLRLTAGLLAAFSLAAVSCGSDSKSAATTVAPATMAVATTAAAAVTTGATSATSAATQPAGSNSTVGPTTSATDTTGATGTTAKTAEGPATGVPIKLVALIDVTGRTARQDGATATVIGAWVKWVNDNGGVGGRPVDVTVMDTKGDPAAATSAAQQIISDAAVAGVFSVDSITESVYSPLLSAAGVPIVGGHGLSSAVWGKLPNTFGVMTTQPSATGAGPLASHEINGTNSVAAIVCAENPLCAQTSPLYTTIAKNSGITFDGLITAAFDAPDYTAECLQLKDKKTKSVILALGGATAVRVINGCLTQDYSPDFVILDGSVTKENLAPVDAKAKVVGAINGFPWWIDTPAVKHYRDVMTQKGVAETDWANSASTATWASLELFRKVMATPATAGTVDRKAVIAAYGRVHDETLDGLVAQPLTFTADAPMPRNNCFWYYSYSAGTFTAFNGGKPSCFDPALAAS